MTERCQRGSSERVGENEETAFVFLGRYIIGRDAHELKLRKWIAFKLSKLALSWKVFVDQVYDITQLKSAYP